MLVEEVEGPQSSEGEDGCEQQGAAMDFDSKLVRRSIVGHVSGLVGGVAGSLRVAGLG